LDYHVKITDSALSDAQEYVHFIRQVKKEPEAAERWFRGLVAAIFSLEQMPSRCALIPEAEKFPLEIRHRIFHSHRIIFHINEKSKTVTVLRVYHASRRKIEPADL
jgi:plasmid stabilization system protein ParE